MGSRDVFSLVDTRSGKIFKVYKDDRYKFRRSCLALDRVALEFPNLQLYFLTLTLSDANLKGLVRVWRGNARKLRVCNFIFSL